MENTSEIRPGALATIRGGTFKVLGESDRKGFWDLEKIHGRKVVFSFPETEVLEGILEHGVESVVAECSRQESPAKDAARLKYLPRNTN